MSEKTVEEMLEQAGPEEVVPEDLEDSNFRGALATMREHVQAEDDPTITELEKKLGPRRHAFVREFLRSAGDVKAAAVAAGYPESHGVKLLNDKTVRQVVLEKLKARGFVQNLSPDWVMLQWARLAQKCAAEVPEYDRKGNMVGTKIVDASNANRALESIARALGMFKDTLEVGGTDKPIEVQRKEVLIDIQSIAKGIAGRIFDQSEGEGDDSGQ